MGTLLFLILKINRVLDTPLDFPIFCVLVSLDTQVVSHTFVIAVVDALTRGLLTLRAQERRGRLV